MRTISLAAGTILDVGPADAVDVAADAGFGAVGIWFDAATWTDAVADDVRARAEHRGLILLDIEPIIMVPEGSSGSDNGEAIVDAAMRIGARNILVASRDPDDARVAERLRVLAQRLEGSGIRLVLEFLPIMAVRTLPQALSIVRAADHRCLGVLIDSLHLARAGHHPTDLAGIDPGLLPYLQVCDAPAAPADTTLPTLLHEALHGRLLPGDGALPITDLLRVVPNVPLSMELRSESLRTSYPDPVARARAVRDSMERALTSVS
jgi:sugar phosphate isomerase/epimerase